MKKIMALWSFMKGKKTFFVGGLMILLGLLNGDNNQLLDGLGLITLRMGVGN
jgi:hypothetical protein